VRFDTAAAARAAQHGCDTSNKRKAVTMRPVRILLVLLALVAVGLAGWALGARDPYRQPAADPAVTQATPPATTPAAPGDPAPQGRTRRPTPTPPSGGNAPSATTRPAPRPRIFGFGSEPVYPQKGGFWRLPAGPGEAVLIADAQHATRVEFLLTPAGTGSDARAVSLGVDADGRDAYAVHWRYADQPLLAHLTVRATGPGGTAEQTVGVYHPDPEQLP
jgi:hypothetical protein